MVKSKSDEYLENRKLPPLVSNNMYKSVSNYRKGTLEAEVEQGKFRDGTAPKTNGLTAAGIATHTATINKNAQAITNSTQSGANWRGSGGTVRQIPEVYSPLWLNSNLNLPRDRATINAWCRSFFALQPPVQNAINLHSTYPIGKMSIKCKNKKVEQFFNEMVEEIDLMNVCVQAAQEYWLLGEAFIYAELDETKARWSRLIIQNPDYVVVKRSVIASEPLIMLRPDENLRRIVFSNRPADIEQKRQLNDTIVEHIKRGENIPLDNFYVSHLARKISPYEMRGTGLPVSCFRQLMLFDFIRESKLVQAQSMINPLTLVKVGTDGIDGLHPTAADLEVYREALEQSEFDRNFKLITHSGVSIERIGYNQGIIDTSGDITQLLKEIYMGLMVPSILMDGGGDITYANGGVALEVLRDRYMQFRNMLAAWLKKKIFLPISKLNDFYEYEDGEKRLIIPEIEWGHLSAFDSLDFINILVQLSGDQKKVSQHTLYRSLGLDYNDEHAKMKKEDIQDAIRKKELASLDRMTLNDLKALGDDDDIPDIVETPLPGTSPYVDQTGAPPADMGGGLGGLPGLSSPPPEGMPPPPSSSESPSPSGPPPKT